MLSTLRLEMPNFPYIWHFSIPSANALRALALGNANAKCKENLAFAAPNITASENSKLKYYNFFCNTVTMQFYL